MSKHAHHKAQPRTHIEDRTISTLAEVAASLPKLLELDTMLDGAAGIRGDHTALGKVCAYMTARERAGESVIKTCLSLPTADSITAVIEAAQHMSDLGLEIRELLASGCLEILDTRPGGDA